MKKILLMLSLFFASGLVYAAGDPVPGVGVSLEQIPGGIYHTQRDCTKRGGTIIQIEGVAYCGPDVRIINDGGTIVISSSTFTKADCPKEKRKKVVKFKAGSELVSRSKGGDKVTLYQQDGSVAIDRKHSPSQFSTGHRGTFKIVVKNKGNKLEKGMLTVVNHMPVGLSVKTGNFRANSWRCKGGMISSSGQDVTCTYNRKLGKKSRATLNLNVAVASTGSFPADVKEVESCATASVKDSSGMAINRKACCNGDVKVEKGTSGRAQQNNSVINGDVKVEGRNRSSTINGNVDVKNSTLIRGMPVKVCDKVKIRHAKSSGSFNLPIGIGIGMGAIGSGAHGAGKATRGVR